MPTNDAAPLPPPPHHPHPTPMPPSSWAKRTGFKATLSGESDVTLQNSVPVPAPAPAPAKATQVDLEHAGTTAPPPTCSNRNPSNVKKRKDSSGETSAALKPNGHVRFRVEDSSLPRPPLPLPPSRNIDASREDGHYHHHSLEDEQFLPTHSHIKYQLRDRPGLG